MEEGSFTWYKDMGGNSNWMYVAVHNGTRNRVSLALWLLYEAATDPLVDPLCGSGEIQVGFFNQSKIVNRPVPLFELAEESKPMLELAAGAAATLKVRVNDLSSRYQNQRFVLVAGPRDAPVRGSRSVPIEILSKPSRAADRGGDDAASARSRSPVGAGDAKRGPADGPPAAPGAKRPGAAAAPRRSCGSGRWRTGPDPTPERQADLAVALLGGLAPGVRALVAEKLAASLGDTARARAARGRRRRQGRAAKIKIKDKKKDKKEARRPPRPRPRPRRMRRPAPQKDKKKEKKKKDKEREAEEEVEEEKNDEWAVDNTLEEVLQEEGERMNEEMRKAGVQVKEKKKSKKEKDAEAARLKKTEINIRNAESAAKTNVFVMDGKIKDKRDMMGKGTTDESLFDFEATGSSAAEYRKEGNVEFYTQANLHKRKAISCDKVIIKWIDIFWNTFSSVHKTGMVNQAEFVQDWDEDEVREMVESDWVRENGLSNNMDHEKFNASLFELVDTWASSIKLVEYRMFLQKLYFRITGNSGNSANKEKYQRRLKDLEKQQRKLNKNKQKYIEKIGALTTQAKEIATEAKKVRDEKIKAIAETKKLEQEEAKQKARMQMLKDIMEETDEKKRAKLIAKAQKRLAGSGYDITKGIETIIAAEQQKLAEAEAKREQHEAAQRKLAEEEGEHDPAPARAPGAPRQGGGPAQRRGRRGQGHGQGITSLDGESDEATLKQMKNDASFLSFCKENNVEIQEEVEGDVAAEMGGPAKKEEEEEEEQKQEEEVAPTLELVKEDIEIIQQEEAIVFEESEEESESESESEEEEEQEEVVVVEEKKEEVVVEEEKPEDDYDDISVSSEEEEVEEERRPPADFTEWLSKDTWNAWRGMCAGRSPPPEVFGKKRAKSKWDKLSPILGGGGGKRRKKPMTGFGVRRSAHAASNLPPLTPNPALDRYAINTHGLLDSK
ncbi:hypothetical protein JL721_10811 [Aureococcus anophagefferens]|nr:hypothetical protein JL721_10811 [Aureococcus anophagefferens]